MRLHRLEIQAFGPFAERVRIDFDTLTEQGLFLLHGPTGAGKTSILDAICFALYARVPGARQEARRLRSDHAPEGLAPEVQLEFSARGRRFEVTRSPEWQRPRKRGDGLTTEKARTLLREKIDGEWAEGSRDHAESSLQITELLGMKVEQFTRVVLLPQGEFATFLRADAAERKALLQQLFATERYEQVEEWLVERDREARSALEATHQRWRELLAQAEQSAEGLPDPAPGEEAGAEEEAASDDALDSPDAARAVVVGTDPAAIAERLELLGARARAAVAGAEGRAQEASQSAEESARALERLRESAARHRALEEAQAARDEYAGLESLRAADRSALAAHRSALPLLPRLERSEELEASAAALELRAAAALDRLGYDAPVHPPSGDDLGDSGDSGDSTTHADRLAAELAIVTPELVRISDLLEQETELRRRGEALGGRRAALADLSGGMARNREARDEAAAKREALRRDVGALRELGGTEAGRSALLTQARSLHSAAVEAEDLARRVAGRRPEVQDLRDAALAARERFLDLRRLRLDHMASELAQLLGDGEECPVCGATTHPHPAPPVPGAVTAEDERRAEEASIAATAAHEEALAEFTGLLTGLAAAEAGSGGASVADAVQGLEDARTAHAAAVEAMRSRDDTERREAELSETLAALDAGIERDQALLAETRAEIAAETGELDGLAARLAGARGEDASLPARVSRLEERRDDLLELGEALAERSRTREALKGAVTASGDAATAAGFDSVEAARAAILPGPEVLRLEAAASADATRAADIEAQFRRPEVRRAAEEREGGLLPPTPAELGDAEAAERLSREAAAGARDLLAIGRRASADLERKTAELLAELAASATVQRSYLLAHRLADLARGLGDNSLRMSLSSYVLAARLEAVAAAASERLTVMSDGRYTIGYTDALAGRGRKSGLGLDILDGHTGLTRDPKTLSGGETFQASLALALGLADVVQAESGGIDLDTLFVDEGFGTLDEQSLEKVMDILDALRSGGRAVGVISHVPEMRSRITSQLPVLRSRQGSTLGPMQA